MADNVNFRSTLGYVTDAANTFAELTIGGDYPTVAPWGRNVSWEGGATVQARDRNSGNDPRIAGLGFTNAVTDQYTFRIDLAAAGTYPIALAAGDPSYATAVNITIQDSATVLGTPISGSTSAPQRFKDATNTEYTQATWPSSQTPVNFTFATTILRVIVGDGVNGGHINHVSVGAALVSTAILMGQAWL